MQTSDACEKKTKKQKGISRLSVPACFASFIVLCQQSALVFFPSHMAVVEPLQRHPDVSGAWRAEETHYPGVRESSLAHLQSSSSVTSSTVIPNTPIPHPVCALFVLNIDSRCKYCVYLKKIEVFFFYFILSSSSFGTAICLFLTAVFFVCILCSLRAIFNSGSRCSTCGSLWSCLSTEFQVEVWPFSIIHYSLTS